MITAGGWIERYGKIKHQFYADNGAQASEEEFKRYYYGEFRERLYKRGIEEIRDELRRYQKGNEEDYNFLCYAFSELKKMEVHIAEVEEKGLQEQLLHLIHEFPNALKGHSNYIIAPEMIDRAFDEVFNPKVKKEVVVVSENEERHDLESKINSRFIGFLRDEAISKNDYARLKNLLYSYFTNGNNEILQPIIFLKARNKKQFAMALGAIYRETMTGTFKYSYFELIKNNINEFHEEAFTEEDYANSNLMKYLTAKPPKKRNSNAKYARTGHFGN